MKTIMLRTGLRFAQTIYRPRWRMSYGSFIYLLMVFGNTVGEGEIVEPAGRDTLMHLYREAQDTLHIILLPPNKEQCFYQYSHAKTLLKCLARTPNLPIRVTHSGPDGLIFDKVDWLTRIVTNVTKDGDYEFCFTNLSPKPTNMRMRLTVFDDETILRSYHEGLEDDFPRELIQMWEAVAFIGKRLRWIQVHCQHHLKFVANDRSKAMKKFKYVNYWSLVECFVIITAGVLQVSAVRYILRPAKPRSGTGPTY